MHKRTASEDCRSLIEVGDDRLKDAVRSILKAYLADMGVLAEESGGPLPPLAASNLTFEQKKEMLLLQLEHDKLKQRTKIEKQIAIEKMCCEMEQAKLSLQRCRLDLITNGKMVDGSVDVGMSPPPESPECFDMLGNLPLLPKFNVKEPETFFSLFKQDAEAGGWPESARTLMLGQGAGSVFRSLVLDGKDYECAKSVVLKAHDLVPEAYCIRFHT